MFTAAPSGLAPSDNWPLPNLVAFFGTGLVLYCLSQWLAFSTRVQPENIAIFWPPAGVMLALLVASPRPLAWLMAGALAVATLFCNYLADRGLGFSAMLTFNDVVTGVIGAKILRKWLDGESPVSGIRSYSAFLAIVALSAFASAILGSTIVHYVYGVAVLDIWHHWFGAMVLGLLVGVPLIIAAQERSGVLDMVKPDAELFISFSLVAALLTAAHASVFSSISLRFAFVLAMVPLLLWMAARRTAFETSVILTTVTSFKILALAKGFGPITIPLLTIPEGISWTMAIFAIQCGAVLMLVAIRSEERAVERDRAQQVARMQSIVDAATDGIISANSHGTVETFSKTAERLFGYTATEVVGNNVKMLMPDAYRNHHDGYMQHYLQTGEKKIIGIGRLVTGLRKDGTEFPMELSVGEALVGSQRVFTGFIRDVTERQKTEQQLHEMQDELLHVSRLSAMGELASALAHELNQPLTAIKNYTQAASIMLKNKVNREELPGILVKTAEQASRAGDIIKRLRSFVTARQVERSAQKVSQLIEDACALALIGARDEGVKSRIVHAKDLPDIQVDRIQIQQVLINLVRNAFDAVKQSQVREITITSNKHEDSVIIQISDTGPGMTPETEATLFKPFVTTKPSGMGIGLSLSRSIAEAHGGSLTYERNPDGGAVFTLTLPIEVVPHVETRH
jgi:two-component system, LuxR family, sensor kinase FixL